MFDGKFVGVCKCKDAIDGDLDAALVEPVFEQVDFSVHFDVRVMHRFAIAVLENSYELGRVRFDDRFVFMVFHFDDSNE